MEEEQNYQIYLLQNTVNTCTYVGITNNLKRRIRQHNGELVGGAKYTKRVKSDGEWVVFGTINNLSKKQALSLEKKIQIRSRKTKGSTPLERRLNCIAKLLEEEYQSYSFIINDENNI